MEMVNRTKEKQISIRLSEEELEKLKANIEISGLNQRDYIAGCILNDSKNISLEQEVEKANAKIKELETSLFKINESSSVDYEKLKNEYDELMETALKFRNRQRNTRQNLRKKNKIMTNCLMPP